MGFYQDKTNLSALCFPSITNTRVMSSAFVSQWMVSIDHPKIGRISSCNHQFDSVYRNPIIFNAFIYKVN